MIQTGKEEKTAELEKKRLEGKLVSFQQEGSVHSFKIH